MAQYIGRLYTLQKLYPETLNDQWIKKHFGINEWMTNWFLFYKKYPVLENAAQHFDEMKNILQQKFLWIITSQNICSSDFFCLFFEHIIIFLI